MRAAVRRRAARTVLAAAALGMLAPLVLTGTASAGVTGPTGGAGYAVVAIGQVSQPDPSTIQLASYQYRTSSLLSPAILKGIAPGHFSLLFRGVLSPSEPLGQYRGVAHARPVGTGSAAACYASRPMSAETDPSTVQRDVVIDVSCTNLIGQLTDTAFAVMWNRGGGTEEGGLVSARFAPIGTALQVAGYTTSLSDAPLAVRNGTGSYYIWVQRDTTGPYFFNTEGLQLSSATPGTTCSVLKTASTDGLYLRVEVGCVQFMGYGPKDAVFDVSYTRGVSVLGMLYGASDAHAILPKLTVNTPPGSPFVSQVQRDRIYGATGTISMVRTNLGSYQVRLGGQAQGTGSGATVITARAGDARCREAASWTDTAVPSDRLLVVHCVNLYGQPVDTEFYLQHTTQQ